MLTLFLYHLVNIARLYSLYASIYFLIIVKCLIYTSNNASAQFTLAYLMYTMLHSNLMVFNIIFTKVFTDTDF